MDSLVTQHSQVITFQDLPLEILHEIAKVSENAYNGMLSIPRFGRSIKPGVMANYMVHFGYSVEITKDSVTWKKCDKNHTVWDSTPNVIINFRKKFKVFKWFKNGVPYRVYDRPNEVRYVWCVDNSYNVTRTIRTLKWIDSEGVKHHLNKPAVVVYSGGKLQSKQWWTNGIQTKVMCYDEYGCHYKRWNDEGSSIHKIEITTPYGFCKEWYKSHDVDGDDGEEFKRLYKIKKYDKHHKQIYRWELMPW